MTEERKQELTQLLHQAMAHLEIRLDSASRHQLPPIINVNEYRSFLQQSWASLSLNSSLIMRSYEFHFVSEVMKSKLLDFIREEFAPFIHEDRIQSASFFIVGVGFTGGYPLDSLLKQLLKIAIGHGIERAVWDFDRGTENAQASFQYIALLEGIRVEAEIQVFEGIRLVPLPVSTSDLSNYLPDRVIFERSELSFLGKTLLIIDAFMFPIFHKPLPQQFQGDDRSFQVEVTGGKFPKFKVDDFYEKFCQALSFVCNTAVQISLKWTFLARDVLFNLNTLGEGGITQYYNADPFGNFTMVGKTQIDEAKKLYRALVKLDSNVREKLQIPIDRWIKSKTSQTAVDKVIDLGIAFEAIYLSDISEPTELSFRLRLRASWFLGKDKAYRQELMKYFSKIYEWRSKAVHTGKLPNKTKRTPYTPDEAEAFIAKAQDLCRDSIIKILEAGRFPDWNGLILGE